MPGGSCRVGFAGGLGKFVAQRQSDNHEPPKVIVAVTLDDRRGTGETHVSTGAEVTPAGARTRPRARPTGSDSTVAGPCHGSFFEWEPMPRGISRSKNR